MFIVWKENEFTKKMKDRVILTCGTFDLLHVGHLKLLQRAKSLGDILVVGVSSDELNYRKKNKYPIYSFEERKELVENLKCVDFVFKEESLDLKNEYIKTYNANVFVIGNDWEGKFDTLEVDKVVYLERTPTISTTETVERILRSKS